MKRFLLFCVLSLAVLYTLQFWLGDRAGTESGLGLTIREGKRALEDRLSSPEFQNKVRELLEKRTELQDEFVAQWSLFKRAIEEEMTRLSESDSRTLRKIAQAVSDAAATEGEQVRVEVARASVPPAHWMVAVVANLILIAWVMLGVTVLWFVARYFARDRS